MIDHPQAGHQARLQVRAVTMRQPAGFPSPLSLPTFQLRAANPLSRKRRPGVVSAEASDISRPPCRPGGLGGVQLQWGSYSLEETRRLTETLQAAAAGQEGTPLFIAVDYEGGSVYAPTTLGLLELPTNMMLGAAADENNTATLFYLAGRELKRAGINMAFGPVLDINTNPKNPIIGIRSPGSDPAGASRLGGAIINGLKAAGVIAVGKHFPGHGRPSRTRTKPCPRSPFPPRASRHPPGPFRTRRPWGSRPS